jgi:xylitol oxidase
MRNWAGNIEYRARTIHHPTSIDEVQALVRGSRRIRALGSRHSFSDIADTDGDLVSLAELPRIIEIDPAARTVSIDGGIRYGELCRALDQAGWALPNLASLPHISVAGAVATATHGSGDRAANLASSVAGIELIADDGERRSFTRSADPDVFDGVVVSLGAIGIVTRLTLDLEPAYRMEQRVYERLAYTAWAEHLDEITDAGYSVSCFADWRGEAFPQVWVKRRVDAAEAQTGRTADSPGSLFGATPATSPRHPIPTMDPAACTPQLGVIGPWHERIPHFRLEHTPSAGDELQSEYIVDRSQAVDAFLALTAISDRLAPLVQVTELRTIAGDEAWLSPSHQRDSVSIHFTWLPDWTAVRALLPAIEAILAPYRPRPHWGKLFTMAPAAVRERYERLPDFVRLAATLDPTSTFRNPYVERLLYAD